MKRTVKVGNVLMGGGTVSVQSMTTVKTSDVEKSVAQILALEAAGCDVARVAVSDEADAYALRSVADGVHIPVVADVHFSAKLAVLAVENGASKLRINPGNIGGEREIALVADCVKAHGVPVRVGANTGSIEKHFLERYGRSAEALVGSALYNVGILERHGVEDIVISVKASDVPLTTKAYTLLSERTDYPLHVGVTEAGTLFDGAVKSAMGLGIMLHAGIGDTLRVSLTDDPVEEVRTARKILTFAGLRRFGPEFISCPTCGRTSIDLVKLAKQVQEALADLTLPIRIAVMGCVVNGPGEAREADLGIAGGNGEGLIFKKGEILYKVPEDQLLAALVQEARQLEQDVKEES